MKRYIKSTVLTINEESAETRYELACNMGTPIDTLIALASDDNTKIFQHAMHTLQACIWNNHLGTSELKEIIDLQDDDLCCAIAECPDSTPEALAYLYDTPMCKEFTSYLKVPFEVARNPNTPIEILKEMLEYHFSNREYDEWYGVLIRERAEENLKSKGLL